MRAPGRNGAILGAAARLALLALLAVLASCASAPPEPPAAPPPAEAAPAPAPPAPAGDVIVRARSRWIGVDWAELPGWSADRTRELWPALLRGCDKPASGWAAVCEAAKRQPPETDAQARDALQRLLRPYRVEAADGNAEGLATGYFEPLVAARRQPGGAFRVPLYGAPADLATRKPWWSRQQIDSQPGVQAALRGRELAYLADPLDMLILHIQGSGRLQITEPDGRSALVRVAFAGHNDQPYKSVGRWLIDQGELKPDQASWPAIKGWARLNPRRVNEMLASNPRYVFFREEPLVDPSVGPRGAQAVPLTPGRSIAVDPGSIPYGTPVWLDTTEPLSTAPLRRAVMAQDTGGAITGAVRADYFWGWGDEAEAQAGRMKQPLRLWALWPKG